MKTLFNYILFVILSLASLSCSNWLEPKPLSFYAPENVYINEEGFESLLITMRKDIKSEHYDGRSPIVNEYAMSDLGVPFGKPNTVVKDFVIALTPSGDGGTHDFPGKLFNLAYNSIRNTNVLISRIDNIEWENSEIRNRLLASAYFFRSYWYYRLVNSYGDVPFIGEEVSGPKLDYYTHSRWAILDKIQKDMEWAIEWMPVEAVPGAETRGAGNHLLAKIALANTDFDRAIKAATDVINGPYQLVTDRFGIDANDSYRNVIWDLHRTENMNIPANTETILAVIDRYEDPVGARTVNGHFLAQAYGPAWWQNGRDSEGNVGMIDSGPQYDTLFRSNANVRPTPYYLYEIWDYKNDLRRSDSNWIEWWEIKYNNPNSIDYGKPVDRDNYSIPVDTNKHSFSFPYYITFVPEEVRVANPTGGNGDMYIFRLAETYLLRAEAHFWKANLAEAAQDLNAVRQRAGALPISSNEVTLDFIFDERARELFAEEPRHGEMVRASYIMAKNNLNGYSLNSFSDNNWFYDRVMDKNWFFQTNLTWGDQSLRIAPHNALWPIPSTVIAANTLGVINQNKGYSGTERNVEPLNTIE